MAESGAETGSSDLKDTSTDDEQIPTTRKRRRRYKDRECGMPSAKHRKLFYDSDTSDEDISFRENSLKCRWPPSFDDVEDVENSPTEEDSDANFVSDLQSTPSSNETTYYTYSSTDHGSPSSSEDTGDHEESEVLESVQVSEALDNNQPSLGDSLDSSFIPDGDYFSWDPEGFNSDFMYSPADYYPSLPADPFPLGELSDEANRNTLSEETDTNTDTKSSDP